MNLLIKKITSSNTKYLNCRDGGTSTPNLYLRNLASKLHFWKKLCDFEDLPMAERPSWSLPIFRIIVAFKFVKPSFIVMSGENDIKILRNIFKFNGYSFWAFSLDALLEMRKIQDFYFDRFKLNRNKTSPTNIPCWGGQFVIGNKMCKGSFRPKQSSAGILKFRNKTPNCCSVNNHLSQTLLVNNKFFLS